MGVANSKRKYSGGPNYSNKRNVDAEEKPEGEEGAEGAEGEEGAEGAEGAEGEGATSGESTPDTPEQLAKNIDGVKQGNMHTWGGVLKDFCALKQVNYKIKTMAKNQPSDKFVEKKIAYTENDVTSYVSGKSGNPLTEYYTEDFDKVYLIQPDLKDLIEAISHGSPFRRLNQIDPSKKDQFTSAIPVLLDAAILPHVKLAVQHKALADVIRFIVTTDKFKELHKTTKIDVHEENIKSGKHSKEEASLANKGNKGAPPEPEPPAQGGGGLEANTGPSTAAEDTEDTSEETETEDTAEETETDEEGDIEGGFGKTAEEKEFKKFKENEKAGFKDKTAAFLLDTPIVIKFLDANEDTLLSVYKSDKSMDKKSPAIDTITPILLEAIDSYEKKADTEGAAGKQELSKAKPDAKGAKPTDGAAEQAASDAAPPTNDKDKPSGPQGSADKPAVGVLGGGDAVSDQTGGGRKKKYKKKRKPRHINIRINVGDKNIIDSSTSDSSTSDSSTSASDSSTSDSSTSTSDSDSTSDSTSDSSSSESSCSTCSSVDSAEKKGKYIVNKRRRKRSKKNSSFI
jgi:hypothetical protein